MDGKKISRGWKCLNRRSFTAAALSLVMLLEPPMAVYGSDLMPESPAMENASFASIDPAMENASFASIDPAMENASQAPTSPAAEVEMASNEGEPASGAAEYSGYTYMEDFKIYKNAVFTGGESHTDDKDFTVDGERDYAFDLTDQVVFSPGFTASGNKTRQIQPNFYMVPADGSEAEDAVPKDEYRRWINWANAGSAGQLKYPDSLYRFWGGSQTGKDMAEIRNSDSGTVESRKLIYGSQEGANLELKSAFGPVKYDLKPGKYRILVAVKEDTDYKLYYTKPVTVTDSANVRADRGQGTVKAGFFDGKSGDSYTATEADKTDEYGNSRDSLVKIGSEKELYLMLEDLKLGNDPSSEAINGISKISFSYDNDNIGDFTDMTTLWPAYDYGNNGYEAGYSSDCACFSTPSPALIHKNGMTVLEGIHLIPENKTDYSKLMQNGFSYRLIVETTEGNTYVAEGNHKFIDETNPEIKTRTLQKVRPGEAYSMQLLAEAKSGGVLTWKSIGRGYKTSTKGGRTEIRSWMDDLPPGLLLASDGTISGTFDPAKGPERPSGSPEDDSYKPSREELMNQKWYFLRFLVTETKDGKVTGTNRIDMTLRVDWSLVLNVSGLEAGEKAGVILVYNTGGQEQIPLGPVTNGKNILSMTPVDPSHSDHEKAVGGKLFLERYMSSGYEKDERSATVVAPDRISYDITADDIVYYGTHSSVGNGYNLYADFGDGGSERYINRLSDGRYRFLSSQTLPQEDSWRADIFCFEAEPWQKYLLEDENASSVSIDQNEKVISISVRERPSNLTLKGRVVAVTAENGPEGKGGADGKYPVEGALVTVTQKFPAYAGYSATQIATTDSEGYFTVSGLYGGELKTSYKAYSANYPEGIFRGIRSGDGTETAEDDFGVADADITSKPYELGRWQNPYHYLVLIPCMGTELFAPSFCANDHVYQGAYVGQVVWTDEKQKSAVRGVSENEAEGKTVYEAYLINDVPGNVPEKITVAGIPGDVGKGVETSRINIEGGRIFEADGSQVPKAFLLDYSGVYNSYPANLTVLKADGSRAAVYVKRGQKALIEAGDAKEEYTVILSSTNYALPQDQDNRVDVPAIGEGKVYKKTQSIRAGEVISLSDNTGVPVDKTRAYAVLDIPASAPYDMQYEVCGTVYPGPEGLQGVSISTLSAIEQVIINGRTIKRNTSDPWLSDNYYDLGGLITKPASIRVKLKMLAADSSDFDLWRSGGGNYFYLYGKEGNNAASCLASGLTKCSYSLSLSAPEKAARNASGTGEINISGAAADGANIYIYDNDVPVTVLSSQFNVYSGRITLTDSREHIIRASYISPDQRAVLGDIPSAYTDASAQVELVNNEAVLTYIQMDYSDGGGGIEIIGMRPGDRTLGYSIPSEMSAKYTARIDNVYGTTDHPVGLEKFSYAADSDTEELGRDADELDELIKTGENERTDEQKARIKELEQRIEALYEEKKTGTEAYAFFNVATAGGLYTIPATGFTVDEQTHTATVTSDTIDQGDDFTTGITVEYQATDPGEMLEKLEGYESADGTASEARVIAVRDEGGEGYEVIPPQIRKGSSADLVDSAALAQAVSDVRRGAITEEEYGKRFLELLDTEGLESRLKEAERAGLDEAALITNDFWNSTASLDPAPEPEAGTIQSRGTGAYHNRAAGAFQSRDVGKTAGEDLNGKLPEAIKLRNAQLMENMQTMKELFQDHSNEEYTEDGETKTFDDSENPFREGGDFKIEAFGMINDDNADITAERDGDGKGAFTITYYQDFASAVDEQMLPSMGYMKSTYEFNGYYIGDDGRKHDEDPVEMTMYYAKTCYKGSGLIINAMEKNDGTATSTLETYIFKNPEVEAGNPFRWTRIQMATVAPGEPSPVYKGGFVCPLKTWQPVKNTYAGGSGGNPAGESPALGWSMSGGTGPDREEPVGESSFSSQAGSARNGAGWSLQVIPKEWDDYSSGTKWGLLSLGLSVGGAIRAVQSARRAAELAEKGLVEMDKAEKLGKAFNLISAEEQSITIGTKQVSMTVPGVSKLEYVYEGGKTVSKATRETSKVTATIKETINIGGALDAADKTLNGGGFTAGLVSLVSDNPQQTAAIENMEEFARDTYNEAKDNLRYITEQMGEEGTLLNKYQSIADDFKNRNAELMDEVSALEEELGYTRAQAEVGNLSAFSTGCLGVGVAVAGAIPVVNAAYGVGLAVSGVILAGVGFVSSAATDNKLASAKRKYEELKKKKERLEAEMKPWGIPPEKKGKNSGGSGNETGTGQGTGSGTGTPEGQGKPSKPGDPSGDPPEDPPVDGPTDDPTDDPQNNKKGKKSRGGKIDPSKKPGDVKLEGYHDPSGIVYEAVRSNPVEDASVRIYTNSSAINANWTPEYDSTDTSAGVPKNAGSASGYTERNIPDPYLVIPNQTVQVTGKDGRYSWDVHQGLWYVEASAKGYEDGNSNLDKNANVPAGETNWLPVLPAQLDVNIPLVDSTAPKVEDVIVRNDSVYITFDKYMKTASLGIALPGDADEVSGNSIQRWTIAYTGHEAALGRLYSITDGEGKKIPCGLSLLDAEQAPSNIRYVGEAPWYASRIKLQFDGELEEGEPVKLVLYPNGSEGFVSYAGTQMETEEHDAGEKTETVVYASVDGASRIQMTKAPVITPEGGEIKATDRVTITCEESNAVIYYTTDVEEELSTDCDIYTGPFVLAPSSEVTVRTFAVKAGKQNSVEKSAVFHVSGIDPGPPPKEPGLPEPDTDFSDEEEQPVPSKLEKGVTGVSIIPPAGLDLTRVMKGKKFTLKAEVFPSDATDQKVIWQTSSPSVLSVDQKGNVRAKSAGTATIRVITEDCGYTAKLKITVYSPVTKLILNKTKAVLGIGGTVSINAAALSDDGELSLKPAVTWTSSNASVAEVKNGVVTGKSPGKARITASSDDGSGKTAVCNVRVGGPVTALTISQKNGLGSVKAGGSLTLTAASSPSKQAAGSLKWVSSDPSVAAVSQKGTVTGIRPGEAVISAYLSEEIYGARIAADGYKVTVAAPDQKGVKAESIILRKKNKDIGKTISLASGKSLSLTAYATVNGKMTKLGKKDVVFYSQDPYAVSVTPGGRIKAVKGEDEPIIIKAVSLADPAVQTEVAVKCYDAVKSFKLNANKNTIGKGRIGVLVAVSFAPSDASDKSIKWTAPGKGADGTPVLKLAVIPVGKTVSDLKESDFKDASADPVITGEGERLAYRACQAAQNTVIKAVTVDGNKKITVRITVKGSVTGFELRNQSTLTGADGNYTVSLPPKGSVVLKPVITAEYGADRTIVWRVRDPSVASWKNGRLTVAKEAKAGSSAVVTGTTIDGKKKVNVTLTVK
ncbi:MAG: Ig-like domain-containing protein [Lachnospiraceae bacterium]|nr:Ig-like domain-containing protein [Lachnospiraceae bacterium]